MGNPAFAELVLTAVAGFGANGMGRPGEGVSGGSADDGAGAPADGGARAADGSRLVGWDESSLSDPHGAADKARRVRAMFDAIAGSYERVNSVFSGGRDAAWRRRAVALARVGTSDRVLDVACGTGDLTRAFAKAVSEHVVGIDFSHAMLMRAADRVGVRCVYCEGDALRLPFSDGVFSVVSCAFGVRNFQDLPAGLAEFHRVLGAGGRVAILEFTRPRRRWVRRLYEWYSGTLMPRAATWVSGDRTGAYRYLPRSVVSFADADQMCTALRDAGFAQVKAHPLTLGVVTIYTAVRPGESSVGVGGSDRRDA